MKSRFDHLLGSNKLRVSFDNDTGEGLFGRYGDYRSEKAIGEERYVFAPGGARFNYSLTLPIRPSNSRP